MYPLEGETDMAAEAPQLSDAVHLLVSARFDIYSSWGCVEQPHDVFLHAWLKISHLWTFENERHIDVADPVTVPRHNIKCVFHELRRITSSPSRIGVLKNLTNIWQRQGSEDGIDDGVVNDVPV